jgi:hypothetical protein
MSSSYLLENIHDHYTFPMNARKEKEIEFSPMTPMNLDSRLMKKMSEEPMTPELAHKKQSCDFGDISEGRQ